ncbi:MAG: ATP-dependent DNA helicase [Gammaproteobacteria bacterium]|nr:ATP-dependent DNA helicase [Gammaproteobacteria bacterium]
MSNSVDGVATNAQSSDMQDWFGSDGRLADAIDGFQPRQPQIDLAEAVADAIDDSAVLVAEAGTGTGKTYAYLLPALLGSGKTVISTGTRHLQDQLYHRDLPTLQKAVGRPLDVALLKGRANYLCLHRLEIAREEASVHSLRDRSQLDRVKRWADETSSGDLAEFHELPETSPLRPRITSTPDNCLGQSCPVYSDCHVLKARRKAQEADLVVVNHHLLLADMVLKEEGFGELLPGADTVIVDEAHQLPEIATQYFGTRVSSRQLIQLARDCVAESLQVMVDGGDIEHLSRDLEHRTQDLRLSMGTGTGRYPMQTVQRDRTASAALEQVCIALDKLTEELEPLSEESRGLENCLARAQQLIMRLDEIDRETSPGVIRWAEATKRGFILNATPVDPGERFHAQVYARPSAWIFTSATLAVAGKLDHFITRLGLEEPRQLLVESPFDYANNALLYVPEGMPEPNTPDYTRAILRIALPLLRASRGRAFLLFTSYRALDEAAELLRGKLEYPVMVQGDKPRSQLLEEFRQAGDAVLLGTGSFWEGVDVRGQALSLVIIDKLPFSMPDDPVLQARLQGVRDAGGNPFMDVQVPQAVIGLKQGVGRLIRDTEDRGALVLCDPRLYSKAYGKTFLASLPPMSITRDAGVALGFLNDLD